MQHAVIGQDCVVVKVLDQGSDLVPGEDRSASRVLPVGRGTDAADIASTTSFCIPGFPPNG